MPNADLHQSANTVYEIGYSPSFSRTGGSTLALLGSANFETRWAPRHDAISIGFQMYYEAKDGSTGPGSTGTYAHLEIPDLGISQVWNVSTTTNVASTSRLEIDNRRVYSYNGGVLEVRIDAIRWIVDGTVRWSTGAVYIANASYFCASAIPLIGIPANWSCGAAVDPVPILGTAPTPSTTPSRKGAEITVVVSGLWTDDGNAYPVLIELTEIPSNPCTCEGSAPTTLSASTTADVSIQAFSSSYATTVFRRRFTDCLCPDGAIPHPYGVFDVWDSSIEWISKESAILTIPNLPARVKRFDPDNYRAVIIRGGFPKTTRGAYAGCQTHFPEPLGDDSVVSVVEEVHPRQTSILGNVGGSTHALEDTLAYSVPSPASKRSQRYLGQKTTVIVVSPAGCPVEGGGDGESFAMTSEIPECFPRDDIYCYTTQGTAFNPEVDTLAANPYMIGIITHDDATARYVNYWGSRLWSFVYWFPANTVDTDDDGANEAQSIWPMYGAPSPVEYWLMKGDQWEYHSALPGGEQTKRRTTLVSAPLVHGCLGLFIQNYILGAESSWWGDATFKVDDTAPIAEVQLDSTSSPDWTFVHASGSFDSAGVILTPVAGQFQLTAEYAMGNFLRFPYLTPHICDRFYLDWLDANITRVQIYLVGQSGSVIKLGEAKGEVYRPINPADNKYAGSWAQDFGVGIYSDAGSDLLAEGISAVYMADPELVHAFCLLEGRTSMALRFVVDVASDAATAKILYPKFRTPSAAEDGDRGAAHSRVYQENTSQAAVVWRNRPGVRFGNASWYYDSAHHAEPIVLPPGYPPLGMKATALDWLTFRRLVLEARAYNDGLGAEIATLYDANEATTPAAVDNFSVAFLIPSTDRVFPRAALVNGASCPPMCGVPRRGRSSDWKATGAFAHETCSHAVEPRYLVGNDTTHLYNPADGARWTDPIASLAGWPVTVNLHAVENDEGLFYVQRGSKRIAIISPWEGLFCVRRKSKYVRDLDLHNYRGLGLMFEAQATDEDITVVGYNVASPQFVKDAVAYVTADVGVGGISIVCKSDGTILVVFSELGAVKSTRSRSTGEYWSDPMALGFNGKWVDACEDEASGMEFIVTCDFTDGSSSARPWKLYRKLAESESWEFTVDIVTQAEADVTGGNIYFSDEPGHPLIFSFADSGVPRRFRSFDWGDSFTEI